MKINEQTKEVVIRDIFNLIAEGNARIQDIEEKGILLLGKTGAGKSTLAYLLSEQDLEAIEDNKGNLRLEAVKPLGNIKINHTTISETKIPSKCKLSDIAIWDCPGFRDTGGIAQEIANSFYIQRLFETNKHLKFILAMPEAVLDSKSDLIPLVDQFTRGFTDIKALKNSVSLVITKAPANKKIVHVKNAIEEVIEQNSQTLESKTREMLQFLQKSVHIFHRPTTEGTLQKSNLLKEIDNSIEYVDIAAHPELANVAISEESMSYAKELLETTYANLNKLIDIFTNAVERSAICIINNNDNIFIKHLDTIKAWLPSTIEYSDLKRLPKHSSNEYFLDIEQINALERMLKTLPNNQEGSFAKEAFLKILEIFEEFIVDNNQLKHQIQLYAHVFKQQIEYTKFLSQVCANKSLDYSYMQQALEKCIKTVDNSLEQTIKSINLEDHSDIKYYEKAIGYLEQYKNDPICINTKALAYSTIGYICEQQNNYNRALMNYIKALELNKELPITYERIGNILFSSKQYTMAIKCFMVVGNSINIQECFKELIKLDPNNPGIRIDKGDYFLSIGRYDKAMGCYNEAFSVSRDENFKLYTVKSKIATLLEQWTSKTKELIEWTKNKDLYHYNEINLKDLYQTVNKIVTEPQAQGGAIASFITQDDQGAANDNYQVPIVGNTDIPGAIYYPEH